VEKKGKFFNLFLAILIAVTAIIGVSFSLPQGEAQAQSIIYVPDDYPLIQAAVDAANTGDTIIVRAGTYKENVNVNKSITLQGEDRNTTIIDAELATVRMSASSTITGFTIKNGTYGVECTNPITPFIDDNIFT